MTPKLDLEEFLISCICYMLTVAASYGSLMLLLFQCFHRLAHALFLHFVSVRSLEADVFPCNVHM